MAGRPGVAWRGGGAVFCSAKGDAMYSANICSGVDVCLFETPTARPFLSLGDEHFGRGAPGAVRVPNQFNKY